ncbi:MAG TPA: universal stress protein [Flavobacteriaceae bacterium]|nr:universal stress protein [Flavobacteriaceae bacterium]
MQTTNEPLNILVGIDLSEMDTYLFNYLHTLDQILDINKITFLHNIKITELPAVMVSEGRLDVIKGKIISSITRDINATALNHPFEIQVTSERFSETSFNKISERQAFDLLILGNKQNLRGNGALAYKLVRLFSAPVLLVPETYNTPIKSIVQAITFSRYTKAIVDWANKFEINREGNKIEKFPIHVSKLFYYPLMTKREIERVTSEDIQAKQKKWANDFPDDQPLKIIPAKDKGVASTLYGYAIQQEADILILGIKSESKIKDLFIGSVANELLVRPTNKSMLFIKPTKR